MSLSHSGLASSFDAAASGYAAIRPGYPRRIGPFGWSRRIAVEDRLRVLSSHSYLLVTGEEAEPVLRAERAECSPCSRTGCSMSRMPWSSPWP